MVEKIKIFGISLIYEREVKKGKMVMANKCIFKNF